MSEYHAVADDEISLLALLVVVAENWLLLLVPLLAGLAAFGYANFQEKQWTSTVEVNVPTTDLTSNLPALRQAAEAAVPSLVSNVETGVQISPGKTTDSARISLTLPDEMAASAGIDAILERLASLIEDDTITPPSVKVAGQLSTLEEELALSDRLAGRLSQAITEIEGTEPFDTVA